jgi:hypothetical protein
LDGRCDTTNVVWHARHARGGGHRDQSLTGCATPPDIAFRSNLSLVLRVISDWRTNLTVHLTAGARKEIVARCETWGCWSSRSGGDMKHQVQRTKRRPRRVAVWSIAITAAVTLCAVLIWQMIRKPDPTLPSPAAARRAVYESSVPTALPPSPYSTEVRRILPPDLPGSGYPPGTHRLATMPDEPPPLGMREPRRVSPHVAR